MYYKTIRKLKVDEAENRTKQKCERERERKVEAAEQSMVERRFLHILNFTERDFRTVYNV